MSCTTCGHTLGCLCNDVGVERIDLCERCGTVVVTRGDWSEVYVPKLVERCRQFEDRHPVFTGGDEALWHTLGIAESIRLPEDRRPS